MMQHANYSRLGVVREMKELLFILNESSENLSKNNNDNSLMCAYLHKKRMQNIQTCISVVDSSAKLCNGLTLLHLASYNSKREVVEFLLKVNKTSVNAIDNNSETPLMYACLNGGRLDIIETLIQNGANVEARDSSGATLLHIASRYSNQEITEFLLRIIPVNVTNNNKQSALMYACLDGGRLDNIKTLRRNGAVIKSSDINGWTVLHFASCKSKQNVVEFFLNLNEISVNAPSSTNQTSLMHACLEGGRLDNIKTLIKAGADIKAKDNYGATVLHLASRDSKLEVVNFFLKQNKLSVNVTDNKNQTPLMWACLNEGRLEIIQTLIKNGADINVKDIGGLTVLHYASCFSKREVVEFLLKLNDICINVTDKNNRSPLMAACLHGGRLDNIQALIQNGADIAARDYFDSTLLHIASRYSKREVVEFISNLNDICVNAVDKATQSPLVYACFDGGRLGNIKTLIQNGAEITAEDNCGNTIVHLASRHSTQKILEFLLERKEISVNALNNSNQTPLMHACLDGGHLDKIKTLINNGANIKVKDNHGASVLHVASQKSKPEIVEFFLKFTEISVNATDNNNQTPLMHACLNGGSFDNIQMLIQNGADVTARDNHGATLLHIASYKSKREVVELFLKLYKPAANAVDYNNQTPLMFACSDEDRFDNIVALVNNGADIKLRNNYGATLLHFASHKSSAKVLKFLLGFNELCVNATNNDHQTPLMFACLDGGRLENIQTLILHGADTKVKDIKGSSLLHFASFWSKQEVVDFFTKQNEVSVNANDNHNYTPLMYACFRGGRLDNIKTLVNKGANLKAEDNYGATVLHIASRNSKQEVVEYLLKFDEISVNATDKKNRTPLMHACLGDRLDNIKILLKSGADITARDYIGATILHIASINLEQGGMEFLLKLKLISVNVNDNENRTPLMYACLNGGRLNIIKMLIENGADIQAKDNIDTTLLHIASSESSQEVVEYFLKLNEISVNATDKDRKTPLMCACLNGGSLDNVKTLINYGVNMQLTSLDGRWNVFHFACACSNADMVELLIRSYTLKLDAFVRGVNQQAATLCRSHRLICSLYYHEYNEKHSFFLNTMLSLKNEERCEICKECKAAPMNTLDDMGMTPLMVACEKNNLEIVSLLIKWGVAVNMTSIQKYTALHVAARYSNIDLIEVLINSDANVNAIDELGFTPLFWACRGNNLNVVTWLINRGACVNIKSKENWNVLHMAAICADNKMIEFLLSLKIPITAVDCKGKTPLSLACEIKREETIKFLQLNGALLRQNDISLVGTALYETTTVFAKYERQSEDNYYYNDTITWNERTKTKNDASTALAP